MTNKIKEIIKQNEVHLALYKGYMESGSPFHAFTVVNGMGFEKLQTSRDYVSLSDYGEILYSNAGHEVPEYVIRGVTNGFKKRFLKEPSHS